VLAIVHDLANGRIIIRHHHQIHACSFGSGLRLCVRDDAQLGSFRIDQSDLVRCYLIVSQCLFTVAFALDTASLPSRL